MSLEAAAGEVVALLGRNGAGKSTAMKAIMGLVPPAQGEVSFAGRRIERLPPYRIARLGLGYVPEERRIFTELTVMENLEVGRQAAARAARRPGPRTGCSRSFPTSPAMRERPGGRMSGGEQQMLTIARTLMGNPRCVLLDEPSEGLAPIIVEQMAQLDPRAQGRGAVACCCPSRTCISARRSPTAPISSRRARSASAARWPSSPPTLPSVNSIFRSDTWLRRTTLTVGIDVGGTFTDLLAIDPRTNEVKLAKVPTTVDNQAIGFMAALAAAGADPATVQAIVHGTTTTTNALLERKIAKVGLITTKGFRDVLELGRRTRPQPYGMRGTFRPLIEREIPPGSARAHGRRRQGADAARRGRRGRGGEEAAGAGLRGRRHPFPAQLHQSRAREARRRDRACAVAQRLHHARAMPSCRSIASTSAA